MTDSQQQGQKASQWIRNRIGEIQSNIYISEGTDKTWFEFQTFSQAILNYLDSQSILMTPMQCDLCDANDRRMLLIEAEKSKLQDHCTAYARMVAEDLLKIEKLAAQNDRYRKVLIRAQKIFDMDEFCQVFSVHPGNEVREALDSQQAGGSPEQK
jgi:hypothetical protein